jgi:hypothetical protein
MVTERKNQHGVFNKATKSVILKRKTSVIGYGFPVVS